MARASEEMSHRLRTVVQRQRLRFYLSMWLLASLLLAGGAGLAWWLFSRQPAPPLLVVAFDALCSPGQSAEVHARAEPIGGVATNLAGRTLVFQEDNLFPKKGELTFQRVRTDPQGRGQAALAFANINEIGSYLVRLLGEGGGRDVQDQARAYFVPPTRKLVLIDVVDTLPYPIPASWQSDLTAIKLRAEAQTALIKLVEEGWQPVYRAPDHPMDYRQVRRWLFSLPHLPSGPVLCGVEASDEAQARAKILDQLAQHSTQPLLVIVGNNEAARPALNRKLSTIVLGSHPRLDKAHHAASWKDVPALNVVKKP